jgi:uncharacterized protein
MTRTTETSDRNKFSDLALSVNADYLVSEDTDFNVFATLPFPKLNVIGLAAFLSRLADSI